MSQQCCCQIGGSSVCIVAQSTRLTQLRKEGVPVGSDVSEVQTLPAARVWRGGLWCCRDDGTSPPGRVTNQASAVVVVGDTLCPLSLCRSFVGYFVVQKEGSRNGLLKESIVLDVLYFSSSFGERFVQELRCQLLSYVGDIVVLLSPPILDSLVAI